MHFVLPLIYLLFFICLIGILKFFSFEGLRKPQLIGLFLIKCLAGLAVWMIYTWYYSGSDFQVYFNGSYEIFDHIFRPAPPAPAGWVNYPFPGWNANFDDTFNGSRIVIILNVLLHFISSKNIFVHIICFCFLGFAGLCAIYKTIRKYVPEKNYALVIGLFLVPSALFWTAGIYKETLAIFFAGLVISATQLGLKKQYTNAAIVQAITCFAALFLLKMHIAAALFPVILVNVIHCRTQSKRLLKSALLVFVPLVILVASISLLSDRLNVFSMIADKQAKAISEAEGGRFLLSNANFIRVDYYDEDALILQPDSSYRIAPGASFISWKLDNMRDTTYVSNSTDSSSYQLLYSVLPVNTFLNIRRIEPTFLSILKNIPFAVCNVLIRPTLFGVHNALHLLTALENTWLLLLIILTIVCFDKTMWKYKEVIVFCLFFAMIQFAIIGLTTPAVGAIVRYKSTALPFFVMALLLCLDLPKIGRLGRSAKEPDSGKA